VHGDSQTVYLLYLLLSTARVSNVKICFSDFEHLPSFPFNDYIAQPDGKRFNSFLCDISALTWPYKLLIRLK
jgi:hypothetical protein